MALDKDTLQEIKAYMDERSEAWKMQAGDAARTVARDEVLAADGRIAKRNTFFGVGVGVVLLSVAGFSYQAITSGVEASTKQIATEVANDVATEQLSDGARLLELQQRLIDEIITGRGQVVAAMEKAKEAGLVADGISKEVAALQDALEQRTTEAGDILAQAEAKSGELSEQINDTELLQDDVAKALSDAIQAKNALVAEARSFENAKAQLEAAQNLLAELTSGENQVAETAQQIVELALSDQKVRELVVDAAAFPSGAVVPFAAGADAIEACPDGWQSYNEAGGRFILGVNNTYAFGAVGGAATVKLTEAEMPSHSHAISQPRVKLIGGTHGLAAAGNNGKIKTGTSRAGANKPHNNMPPYIALQYCRKD